MLTLLLVWTVALGSLSIFLAGMIFPELSKKNDLIWVGVGLFYALLLWANKSTMGGGLLLGQTAGVSMMVWLGWQAMTQRRELTAPDKKTPVPDWLQKILDVVTPLWEKAYGAIAGQLGLEEKTGAASDEQDALGGIKSQVMGFLDKLNNKTEDGEAATDSEPVAETDDIDDDWEEGDTDETEQAVAEETTPDADEETEPLAEAEMVAEATPDAEPETEAAPTTETTAAEAVTETAQDEVAAEPVAEVAAEPVAEVAAESVAEVAAESVAEVATESDANPANEDEAPVEASPSAESAAEEPVAEPEVVPEATDDVSHNDQPEVPAEVENSAPEASDHEEGNWPDTEPMNSGDPQEESNWPPNEPVD